MKAKEKKIKIGRHILYVSYCFFMIGFLFDYEEYVYKKVFNLCVPFVGFSFEYYKK